MSKHELLQRIVSGNVPCDVATAELVIDTLWAMMNLPPKGEIIRLGGQMTSDLSVKSKRGGSTYLQTTIHSTASDGNVVIANRMKGCDVAIFGVDDGLSMANAKAEPVDEHPGQMKLEDAPADWDMDAAAELAETEPEEAAA